MLALTFEFVPAPRAVGSDQSDYQTYKENADEEKPIVADDAATESTAKSTASGERTTALGMAARLGQIQANIQMGLYAGVPQATLDSFTSAYNSYNSWASNGSGYWNQGNNYEATAASLKSQADNDYNLANYYASQWRYSLAAPKMDSAWDEYVEADTDYNLATDNYDNGLMNDTDAYSCYYQAVDFGDLAFAIYNNGNW